MHNVVWGCTEVLPMYQVDINWSLYGLYAISIFSDNRVLLILAMWSSLQISLLRGRKACSKKKKTKGKGFRDKKAVLLQKFISVFSTKGWWGEQRISDRGCCLILMPLNIIPYFLVIRRTLNFWTGFFQVVKPKTLPKYPVIRCNLNFGLFHYLHFQTIAFSKFLITVMSPFFNKRQKSHTFARTKRKKNHTYKRDLDTVNTVCLLRKQCYFLKLWILIDPV